MQAKSPSEMSRNVFLTLPSIFLSSPPSLAIAPGSPASFRENIAKTASKVPGYGASDVFYPLYFKGVWLAERELVECKVQGEDKDLGGLDLRAVKDAQQALQSPVRYKVRFIEREEGDVIADRAYNVIGERNAAKRTNFDGGEASFQTRWEPSNPNILTLTSVDGTVLETKVTKRSFETPSEDTFGTSEYARVAESSSTAAAVPQLSAIRTLVRYKWNGIDEIQALELVKRYPAVTLQSDPEPFVIVKSRLSLKRMKKEQGGELPRIQDSA